jgi:alkylation response protein AidB-like acyl-CoA dehydrogenase
MDFDLTEEQTLLQETVRSYLREKIVPLAGELDRKGPISKEEAHRFLRDLQPFGYLGTLVPEERGGFGLTHIDWAILYEELRGACAGLGGMVGITSSTSHGIAESPNEALTARILPGLLTGDRIACTAITEPDVGSDVSAIQTRAVLDGNHYVVNGTKTWISNGTIADHVVLVATSDPARGPAGIVQLLVEKDASPFEAHEIKKLGIRSFPTAELVFQDCRVPRENLLGESAQAFKNALRGLAFARCNAAIASVGIAQAAIDASVRYARERKQFGRPIAKFQLIQEMVADMVSETDAARLLTYRAFCALDSGGSARKESSIAKAYATEAAVRVTSKAIQVHGAYGLSEEYPVERYFRDARCYTIPDGTTEIQKLIIGRELLGMSAFV